MPKPAQTRNSALLLIINVKNITEKNLKFVLNIRDLISSKLEKK